MKSLPEVRDAHLHGTRGEDQQGIDIHVGLVDAEPGGRLDAGQIERLAALRAKLEAIVEGAPDVSEQDLVDEILSRRQG